MIDEVLAFWFGEPARNQEELGRKIRRWYMGGAQLDAEIKAKFAPLVEQALAGELDGWAGTPRGRLALILLLDQFTRSIYRNDPKSYAGDAKAQRLASEAFERGVERHVSLEQRNFLIMPFVHAENLAMQERACAAMDLLLADANEWQKKVFAMGLEQANKYRDIITRFGRFPHRNHILGRANTPEEEEFLADWEAKAAPSGSKDL